MVVTRLESDRENEDEDQQENDVAVGEGEKHEPQPGQKPPGHHHASRPEPVDQVAHNGALEGSFQLGQGKGQGGGGAGNLQVPGYGEEIEEEAFIEGASLERVLDCAGNGNPPAVENLLALFEKPCKGQIRHRRPILYQ